MNLSIDQLAQYVGYATVAVTAADKAVDLVQWVVGETPTKADDEAVGPYIAYARKGLEAARGFIGFFAIRLGKK